MVLSLLFNSIYYGLTSLLTLIYVLFPMFILPIVIVKLVYNLFKIIVSPNNSPNKKSHLDIEYFLNHCSICFDKKQELCLNLCRDQFCRDCFDRYVKEVVKNSWGLGVAKVLCPVCQDPVPIAEWSRYVDKETVRLYKHYNQPYRSIQRCCSSCNEPVFEAKAEQKLSLSDRKRFVDDLVTFCQSIIGPLNTEAEVETICKDLRFDYQYFLQGKVSGGLGIYRKFIDRILGALKHKFPLHTPLNILEQVSNLSLKLISIELQPDLWKELQFLHIKRFQFTTWCQLPSCLLCGASEYHFGLTCFQHLQKRVTNGCGLETETDRWTLSNSKPCPHCHILINRDEGCNKVDCLFCGFRFCWICQNQWSEKCGFYQCQSLNTSLQSNFETNASSDWRVNTAPELGIPDVRFIESKLT